MRLARLVMAGLPALVLAGLSAPPAQAAVTSTGVRCTVVGTSGDDVLTGTAGRDVVCGFGGDDVIRTRGGQDLVDAGAGADTIRTGSGADRVLAGPGPDDVATGRGADTVAAGRGADDVAAGPGDDTIEGGAGSDDLEGNGGDDDLTGDAGADHLDGAGGDNICIVDAVDESRRCRYDEQPPIVAETRIEPGSVDVTHQDADVVVRVHASDDTGVEDVQLQLAEGGNGVALDVPPLEQVEGDQRDGWWEATVTVPRWTRPAMLVPTVIARDRLDRTQYDDSSPAGLQVLDDNPDTETPRMWLRSPVGTNPVDVTGAGADVKVSVRATDAGSGVRRIDLCLSKPADAGRLMLHGICADGVARATGTVHDGVWTTTLRIPKGDVSGTWNVTAYATDRAGSGDVRWLGPDAYRRWVDLGACCSEANAFPDGAGALTVIGGDDRTAAWTDQVTATPSEVDTLQVDALTHVSVHALDAAGEAVTRVEAVLLADSDLATAPQFDRVDLAMTAGSATDGTWEGDLVLPQGTPPGTYHVLVFVDDVAHSTGFVGSSYPGEKTGWRTLAGDPVVVVGDTRP